MVHSAIQCTEQISAAIPPWAFQHKKAVGRHLTCHCLKCLGLKHVETAIMDGSCSHCENMTMSTQ